MVSESIKERLETVQTQLDKIRYDVGWASCCVDEIVADLNKNTDKTKTQDNQDLSRKGEGTEEENEIGR